MKTLRICILIWLCGLSAKAASINQFSNAPSITRTTLFYAVEFRGGTNYTNWSVTGELMGLTAGSAAQTLWVATNGSDASGLRGTIAFPFATPNAAASNAARGDVIRLGPGVFSLGTNHLRVPHGVSLRGDARAGSIIWGGGDRSTNGAIVNPGSDSSIENLTIVGTNDTLEQVAFGVQPNSFNAQAFTNVHLSNVGLDADFQGIYIMTNAACSMTMEGCRVDTKNVAIDTDDPGIKRIQAYSTVVYVDQRGAICETINLFGGAGIINIGPSTTVDLYGCDLTVTNAVDGFIYSGIDASCRANFVGCSWQGACTNSFSFIGSGALGATRYYGGVIREGGNGPLMGSQKLTSGAATVFTTAVLTNSRIVLTAVCTANVAAGLAVSNIVAGTSFRVHSTSATDANRFDYQIFNPAE